MVSIPAASASMGDPIRAGFPSMRISPPSGGYTPEMILMRVDFPAPLSPSSASTSPGRTPTETRSTAVRPPKRLVMSRVSSR